MGGALRSLTNEEEHDEVAGRAAEDDAQTRRVIVAGLIGPRADGAGDGQPPSPSAAAEREGRCEFNRALPAAIFCFEEIVASLNLERDRQLRAGAFWPDSAAPAAPRFAPTSPPDPPALLLHQRPPTIPRELWEDAVRVIASHRHRVPPTLRGRLRRGRRGWRSLRRAGPAQCGGGPGGWRP
jgi:hypothetical protein